ncbi:hypothetical protein LMG28614_05504 [Paraburkholderia ultramafica]|uniref:Uncharacterized protein n=1 Tax=Paraburkholderia ultramafica TaxID=1544867 RepID=A0A6S7BKD8_9BURK|nr:site-specific integrase [Paraburkholderia ultramafica]CAB3801833.1 hypothetical protein LMG28614_05504 [Paraburkholderia ultramafica]
MRIRELARATVGSIAVHGSSKQEMGELNAAALRSISSERAYREVLAAYFRWLRANRLPLNEVHTRTMMLEFLDEYAEAHAQKSVNQAIQALAKIFSVRLPRVESCIISHVHGRAYPFEDVQKILARQTEDNQFGTLLCYDGGLRAHECWTLREPRGEGPSSHREWSPDRFAGRTDFVVFLVTGKGGLVREVAISRELAEALRTRARPAPIIVRDREINYVSYFDIGGGQALSASFSYASKRALGYSLGLHGMRHSFAQNRLTTLIPLLGSKQALKVLSVELGHFRPSISLAYLVGG